MGRAGEVAQKYLVLDFQPDVLMRRASEIKCKLANEKQRRGT